MATALAASQEVQAFDDSPVDLELLNDASIAQSGDNPPPLDADDDYITQLAEDFGFFKPSQDSPPAINIPHDIQHRLSKPPLPIDFPPDERTYSVGYWHQRKADSYSRRHRRNLAPIEVLEPGDRYFSELKAYKEQYVLVTSYNLTTALNLSWRP